MNGQSSSSWVLGAIMALVAIFGLVMASHAVDAIFYGTGLALTAFGVLFIFALIRQNNG